MKKIFNKFFPDSKLKDEFHQINSKILNYAILISTLFSLPVLVGLYIRSKTIGLEFFILLQVILVLMLLFLYLLRNKITFKIRIVYYISLLLALIFLSAFYVGALGYWSLNIVFISLIISIFYHRKYAFSILIGITVIIICISYFFHTRTLKFDFNPIQYINSYEIWLAMIMTFLYISTIIIFIVSMQRNYFISSIHQLTNAKEEALLSENKFRNIFNTSTDAFFIINFDGLILEVNLSMVKFMGETEEVLKNKSINDFVLPEYHQLMKDRIKNLSDLNGLPMVEILVKNKSGEVVPVELITMQIEYNNEKAIFSVLRDITERKKIEQKILSTIIQTEEQERSRFAKEIHDGIGPLLSASKIYAKALQKADNEEELVYIISKLNETVDEAIISAQEIANNISPHILQNFGLKIAIESFYQKISKTCTIIFNLESNLKERLNENIETTLYRVVVELINNTIKYANAKSITIVLWKENENISLSYFDDGDGFEIQNTLETNKGMGLSNIESRIKSLDGQISMQSEKQKGFKVEIKINQ